MSEPDAPAAANATDMAGALPFLDALRAQIVERKLDGHNLAVLLIECGVIDRIDTVWGYHIGDAVRGRVIASLRADVLRPGDFIGEMGRDDFACVLSTVEGPAVALLAAEKSLRSLSTPFWIGDDEIFASPAIGIALCPSDGDEAETLLQRAKSACALARDMTSRIAQYADERENPAATRLLYENRLHTAVAEDTLELVFQPQYDLRLGQMIANLVGNGIKYSEKGGVNLTARELGRDSDSVIVEFSVADTGIGIPADSLHLLFEPFSQVEEILTRRQGGSGLGLAIVRQLAELMQGEVGVESTPGEGSRFWFTAKLGIAPADPART